MNRNPYEIRLELLQEARLILQAKAEAEKTPMPTPQEIIAAAAELNLFVSSNQSKG